MAGDDDERNDTLADSPRTRGAPSELPSRFTVKRALGEGGMGTVVEAYDRVLSRDVAIKILGREQHADPNVGTRFLREARAAARLRHPGIVQVHDVDVEGGYIVMELVRGESLATRLWREHKLPIDKVREIGSALTRALAAAHAEGIIHRDVKPANVLLGEAGEIKLADFGVAHFGDSELTMPGTRVGTPAYMPPEQLRGKDVDARADVYAAGITLFEAATGERPTDDRDADHYRTLVTATGDTVFAAAVARAIRDRPAERFADGAAFAAALDATEAPTAPPAARVARGGEGRSRRWGVAIGAVAVVGLAVGVGIRTLRTGHAPAAPVHHKIALLPFRDATHNPLLDFAAEGLPNLLGLELHGVPDVTVIGYYQLADVAGAGAPREAWLAAATKLGADVVVEGEVTAAGAKVHVAITIDTADGQHLDRLERDARVEEVPELVRQSAPAIAKVALGRAVEVAGTAPRSFDADRELQLGIAALERERLPEAGDHLRAAIHHDPDSALAHYYLAIALTWNAPAEQPKDEIAKALATGKLDDAQRGLLAGAAKISDLDYVGAIDVLRPLVERYPDDRELLYVLFESLFHGGRPAEAMSVYRRINAIAPKFRLALVHAFTFYVAHSDEQGMTWVLALDEPTGDAYNPSWEPQILIARREYAQAIELLNRQIQVAPAATARTFQGVLATAYALDGQLDLAESLIDRLAETGADDPQARLAFATLRGDTAARAKWLDATLRGTATSAPGPARALSLAMLVGAVLPVASKAELEDIARALPAAIVPGFERSLNLQLGQALLADALDDTARIAVLVMSPYPEVAELARAAQARRAGDHAGAAAALRRSIAASGDARYLIAQWWLLARELHALADHAAVVAACDEALRPRLMINWAWGAAVGDCLRWTAEADTALGKPAEARAAWTRLAALRTAAPASDPLVTAARAALAQP